MTAFGVLLRLLPVVAAALLLTAQPLGVRTPPPQEPIVAGYETPHRSGDFVTRRQRPAASLEEFFAIDDDADQFSPSSVYVVAPASRPAVPLVAFHPLACHRDPLPSHRSCAGLQTGPPAS